MSEQRTWTRDALPSALDRALTAAVDRGARAPVVLRLTEVAGYTDWGLLLSARSERQVRGIVDGVFEALAGGDGKAPATAKLIGSDGLDLYLWALLDYDDFLIHVFYHPVRRHYDLESMWSDAPRVELGLPAAVMDDSDLDGLVAPDPMPSYRGDLAFGGFEDEFGDDEDDEDPEFADDELFDDADADAGGADPAAQPSADDDLFEN
ncbi:Ribosomal silencing factor RsfS [Enhygromyxa salina]|uniref:Ribosomal silencing factor RsfS n=1 Tax=Enhygromyxa salina TaxID=215803 RepID=A0A2S9XKK2_9BACT|nr:RsfS/YbeB/iojap family protein [Enhygromyxa salina]PRP93409.1 Ribosomal silencing factor RsfS [Enhygromyxa salina]